ncbi:MAG: hypothetical protein BRC31_03380 [Actinobacteria bacterium QS_5_72_10]|nr:MAG: hypothetical protein BRC31_03380 [Actinobacteria bacterium QS_5_72_10]
MTDTTATVTQAYRFALDPTPAQQRRLASHEGPAQFAYNRLLAEVTADCDRYHAGEHTRLDGWSLAALRRHWNANKDTWAVNRATGESWWRENSKEADSSGLATLADGLAQWRASRDGRRAGPPVGFPWFKKRRHRVGVRFTTGAIRCEPDRKHVTLPRIDEFEGLLQEGPPQVGLDCDMKSNASGSPLILEFEEDLGGTDFYINSAVSGPCTQEPPDGEHDVCGAYHGDGGKNLYDAANDA